MNFSSFPFLCLQQRMAQQTGSIPGYSAEVMLKVIQKNGKMSFARICKGQFEYADPDNSRKHSFFLQNKAKGLWQI